MKVVVGAIFGIIQFVLRIVIFVAGMITGGIIIDSSYEIKRKEDRPKTWADELADKLYEDLKKQYSND